MHLDEALLLLHIYRGSWDWKQIRFNHLDLVVECREDHERFSIYCGIRNKSLDSLNSKSAICKNCHMIRVCTCGACKSPKSGF